VKSEMSIATYPCAEVQLWGKGYRISADSEEFQRYLPREANDLRGLERRTLTIPWASLMESLYSLREVEVAAQRCVLFNASELLSISFAKTEDRHRRPSLVLTTCTVAIDWRDPQLGGVVARAVALSSQLATTYAEILKGNPDNVGKQLRDGSFLTSRSFDLGEERADRDVDWVLAISAVKTWNGITGIGTPRLLAAGANVVLGTKHEAERARQQCEVDGFLDARNQEIRVLSDRLKLWDPQPLQASSRSDEQESKQPRPFGSDHQVHSSPSSPELYWIAECLQQLVNSVDRLVGVSTELLERLNSEKRRK